MSAADALAHVAANAGASLWRDEADDYVLAGARVARARRGDHQRRGEPWAHGMADAWESAHGLNPSDAEDRNADRDDDGWTNLEEYVNSLASP